MSTRIRQSCITQVNTMDVASCLFGNCDVCASYHVGKNIFTEYCCQGGFDLNTFQFIMPCDVCMQRMKPATQDLDDYELDSILFGYGAEHSIAMDGDTDVLFQDICKEYAARWPKVNIPLQEERVTLVNGSHRLVRLYKPFDRNPSRGMAYLLPHEEKDFKEFCNSLFS